MAETHYRGLVHRKSMKELTHVAVPKVPEKNPEGVRLNMTRSSKDYQEWKMEEMLQAFLKEFELCEHASQIYDKGKYVSNNKVRKRHLSKSGGQSTASVLLRRKTDGRFFTRLCILYGKSPT